MFTQTVVATSCDRKVSLQIYFLFFSFAVVVVVAMQCNALFSGEHKLINSFPFAFSSLPLTIATYNFLFSKFTKLQHSDVMEKPYSNYMMGSGWYAIIGKETRGLGNRLIVCGNDRGKMPLHVEVVKKGINGIVFVVILKFKCSL